MEIENVLTIDNEHRSHAIWVLFFFLIGKGRN